MPKIVALIPPQGFELIRDRIAEIIIDEMENQQVLSPDPQNIQYFVERSTPVAYNECPLINIGVVRGDYEGKYAANASGAYQYFIDCYTSAATTPDNEGDNIATLNMQRLLGVCRAIIENPVYKILGFAPPFISRVTVNNFTIEEPGANAHDTQSVAHGRLLVTVAANEVTEKLSAPLIAGYETEIKIGPSGVGYHYSKPQPI